MERRRLKGREVITLDFLSTRESRWNRVGRPGLGGLLSNRPICLRRSATCSPTSPCGGTVNPSWPLLSSAWPTCICMNWGTCGRSSSTWPWGLSWPCRSGWGSRWAKPRTTTSDRTSQRSSNKKNLKSWAASRLVLVRLLSQRWSCRPPPGPGGISARIGLFLEGFLFLLVSVNLQACVYCLSVQGLMFQLRSQLLLGVYFKSIIELL